MDGNQVREENEGPNLPRLPKNVVVVFPFGLKVREENGKVIITAGTIEDKRNLLAQVHGIDPAQVNIAEGDCEEEWEDGYLTCREGTCTGSCTKRAKQDEKGQWHYSCECN